jgi:mannose-1-phosphate guanylyltransferase/mannose-6-phosphate isomerase
MSGGAGTRLWPASRSDKPKQFLPLVDHRTMVRATLDRMKGLDAEQPLIVANASHAELAAAELKAAGFDPERMILEPFGRNTAPAAAVAALELTKTGDDPLMLLLPADHVIDDLATFHRAVRQACRLAAAGNLVTFGIVPTQPETGYGYIRTGAAIDDIAHEVEQFVEKPDLPTATAYLADGRYLWNSGMFVFRCSDYLAALAEFAPDMLTACKTTMDASTRARGVLLDATEFAATPADSIDYAVMEKTRNAAVVPLDAGWNDVGSWTALWAMAAGDHDGNVTVGDVITTGTTNSYIRSDSRLVAVAGLDNIVVVATPDAVLVTTLDNAQAVKNIVDILRNEERAEATKSTHTE